MQALSPTSTPRIQTYVIGTILSVLPSSTARRSLIHDAWCRHKNPSRVLLFCLIQQKSFACDNEQGRNGKRVLITGMLIAIIAFPRYDLWGLCVGLLAKCLKNRAKTNFIDSTNSFYRILFYTLQVEYRQVIDKDKCWFHRFFLENHRVIVWLQQWR